MTVLLADMKKAPSYGIEIHERVLKSQPIFGQLPHSIYLFVELLKLEIGTLL